MCRMPGAVAPGQTQLERTPCGAPSSASTWDIMTSAALLTE